MCGRASRAPQVPFRKRAFGPILRAVVPRNSGRPPCSTRFIFARRAVQRSQTPRADAPDPDSDLSEAPSDRPMRTALVVGACEAAPDFVAVLQAGDVLTGVADRWQTGLKAARKLRPDLVILVEPARDSVGVVRRLCGIDGVGRILVLLNSIDTSSALELIDAGADDVVAPPHEPDTVLLRARLARRRFQMQATLPHTFRTIRIEEYGDGVFDADGPIGLRGRSVQLLKRLLRADGQVVPRETLLRDIWGSDDRSVSVLDAAIHRLRRKLEANPANPKIITTVRGVGYRLEIARVEVIRDAEDPPDGT